MADTCARISYVAMHLPHSSVYELPPPSVLREAEELSTHDALALFTEAERRLDPHETVQQRAFICWRMLRRIARAKGLVLGNTLLQPEMMEGRHPFRGSRIVAGDVEDVMSKPQHLPLHPQHCNDHRESLARLQSGYLLLAYLLKIPQGADKDPYLGADGLQGLTGSVEDFAYWFPSIEQIIRQEQDLIERTCQFRVSKGVRNTRRYLIHYLGLTNPEVNDMMALAQQFAVSLAIGSIEEKQGIMTLRIEELLRRAQQALDLKTELGALKLLTQVQGLAQASEEDRQKALMRLLQANPLPEVPMADLPHGETSHPRITVAEESRADGQANKR